MSPTRKPTKVLLVEADAVIGLDLGDALVQAGYRLAGPVATLAAAAAQVERHTPDLAVIDVRFKDGLSIELARELRQRGVPFVVHSAWRRGDTLCPEIQEAPWLAKPTLPREVIAALGDLKRGASQ